ncbi:glycosyltransferase family 4 protein [Aneurinibacillus aneurinilyticus]|uniref:glycosyltransferase family 4 protein n=1 Tax=Aneurinibacillus aneurinilyticus TaxID=1391 RepID=UPI002E1A2509|nr:glycosyltransferase family 4 protein [Aneurinibacillus aneurinilyticus]
MNILVVSQYYYPEIGAASKRITELTKYWAKEGHNVYVYTTIPNYPKGKIYEDYSVSEFQTEIIDGVKVLRNKISLNSYRTKLGRLKSYLSFLYYSLKNLKHIPAEIDVIVTTIGPVFSAIVGNVIASKKKLPHILEFRDITYKQMEATNFSNKLIVSLVKKFELFFASRASYIVTVTDTYSNILFSEGIKPSKVFCIPNGHNFTDQIYDHTIDSKNIKSIYEVITNEKQKGSKILAYFGTLGISQGIEEIIDKIDELKGISFLIIGNGSREERIKGLILEKKLDNVFIFPSIEEKYIRLLYKLVDFNLVKIVNNPGFSGTIPSKIFEILGNGGLPLFVGPKGEARKVLEQISSELYFDSVDELINTINTLVIQNLPVKELKKEAVDMVFCNYNRAKQAQEYVNVLRKIEKESVLPKTSKFKII